MNNIKFEFDFGVINEIAVKELEAISKEARERIKERTPVRTGKLLKNIKVGNTTKIAGGYSKEIYTDLDDVEYAGIVENGVKGKTYKYNTGKGVKYGEGAKMYEDVYYIYQTILGEM